jgi:hypothetical protein
MTIPTHTLCVLHTANKADREREAATNEPCPVKCEHTACLCRQRPAKEKRPEHNKRLAIMKVNEGSQMNKGKFE